MTKAQENLQKLFVIFVKLQIADFTVENLHIVHTLIIHASYIIYSDSGYR